jgi:hypothetical protein
MRSVTRFYLLFCICALTILWAQTDRGVITGTVNDATGAVVPGAQVTAIQAGTNASFKTRTTTSGDFTVPSLPVGNYQVRVENPGFKTYIANDVVLATGATVLLNVTLELGATLQTIEVSATAQLLQSETARVATEVSSRLVDELPVMVGGALRSPFDLSISAAEVNSAGQYRIGGGRGGAYGMTLDGTTVQTAGQLDGNGVTWTQINTPSIDALTEFSVTAGGFKAEMGHASGGTMSFVSKSGTNEFHGTAYEFLRNQVLDARGFFGATKAVYKQNDFGVTAGGPVIIPKLYHGRDKTFFFVSYEGFRNRAGASPTPYSVPPQEFFTGDLHNYVDASGKMYQVYDPATTALVGSSYTRAPFANNQIPQSRIDPISKSIISFVQPLLKANVPGIVPGTTGYVRNNYLSAGSTIAPNNKFSAKGDQVLTSKQRVSFFFERTRQKDLYGPTGAPGLPKPLAGNPGYNRSDVYRISHDYTISPTLLNRFYAGGNNWEQNHGSYATYSGAPQAQGIPTTPTGWKERGICIPNYPDCNVNFPIVNFSNSEFTNWGVAAPNGSDNIVVEFHDDMTKTTGPHTFKWGYYYNNTHYNGFGLQNMAGNVTFQALNTSVPLITSQATGGGSAFASFLLGQVSGYSLDTPRYLATMFRTHHMYFQDDWRVTRKLTLNLGLRYEINLAPRVGKDEASDLDPAKPNPGAGGLPGALVFAGYGTGRQNTHTLVGGWHGAGPRFGFAYSLTSKTVLRGAATRSFGPITYVGNSSHNLGIIQRITVTDQSQGLNPLWVLQNGAPAWAQVPNLDPSVGNGSNVPYYNGDVASRPSDDLTYSFNIEQQVTGSTLLEVGYLGMLSAGTQSALLAYNQIDFTKLAANLSPFTASGRTLLNSQVGSAAANAAAIVPPWPGFNKLWGTGSTVAQSLRPFPHYSAVDTTNGQGDRIGHSTYHSMQVKFSKRYSAGLTVYASYVLSKLLTDADSGGGTPENHYNRRLEKSIASYDQTHVVKLNYVYELPFGKARKFLNQGGVVSAIVGGWRFSGIQSYSSGTPFSLGTTISFPIFNGGNRATVATYDGWRGAIAGSKFDPALDRFLQPVAFFGTQPTDRLGTNTRYNPKLRNWPGFGENVSLARSIKFSESKRLDFRWEAFNLLNRTTFSSLSGGATLQNANFGLWRNQGNSARRMQVALKLYW